MYTEVRKLAADCQHLTGVVGTHRFAVFNRAGLNAEDVLLEGVKVRQIGIAVTSNVDIHAVLNNVLWEDEHCLHCCGALLGVVDANDGLLMRCGPTIGSRVQTVGSVVDEYWTD